MFNIFKRKSKSELEEYQDRSDKRKANKNLVYGDYSFKMDIEDVFTITGRGTVVTGVITSGIIRINDFVEIHTDNGVIKSQVSGIEASRKLLKDATVGNSVGILLKNINHNQLKRGDYIIKV